MAERCPACPGPDDCTGRVHRPICGYVAAGRREWIEQLIAMANGTADPPPSPAVAAQVRLALARNACPMGSKAGCGCDDLKMCSREGREVSRAFCYDCLARDP